MNGPEPRERAEAAFGHVRLAATEMIAAARDALDLLDDVVATADLDTVLAGFNHLTRSVWQWRPPTTAPPPASQDDSPVEHISVH